MDLDTLFYNLHWLGLPKSAQVCPSLPKSAWVSPFLLYNVQVHLGLPGSVISSFTSSRSFFLWKIVNDMSFQVFIWAFISFLSVLYGSRLAHDLFYMDLDPLLYIVKSFPPLPRPSPSYNVQGRLYPSGSVWVYDFLLYHVHINDMSFQYLFEFLFLFFLCYVAQG